MSSRWCVAPYSPQLTLADFSAFLEFHSFILENHTDVIRTKTKFKFPAKIKMAFSQILDTGL